MADFSHDVRLSDKEIEFLIKALSYDLYAYIDDTYAHKMICDLIDKLEEELKEE